MLTTLQILEELDAKSPSSSEAESAHRLTEAFKHAFADRAEVLGDADFADVPVARLISREHARELASRIDHKHTQPTKNYGRFSPVNDAGTTHFSVIDAEGNATPVKNEDFELVPGRIWTSNETGGDYPVEWKLRIPKLNLDLDVSAAMDGQELVLRPISYWEGSVQANGTRDGKAVQGRGYLEMTGYAGGLVGLQAPETR